MHDECVERSFCVGSSFRQHEIAWVKFVILYLPVFKSPPPLHPYFSLPPPSLPASPSSCSFPPMVPRPLCVVTCRRNLREGDAFLECEYTRLRENIAAVMWAADKNETLRDSARMPWTRREDQARIISKVGKVSEERRGLFVESKGTLSDEIKLCRRRNDSLSMVQTPVVCNFTYIGDGDAYSYIFFRVLWKSLNTHNLQPQIALVFLTSWNSMPGVSTKSILFTGEIVHG